MRPLVLFLLLLTGLCHGCGPSGPPRSGELCVAGVRQGHRLTLRPSLSGFESRTGTGHNRTDLPVPGEPTTRGGPSNRASGSTGIGRDPGPHEKHRSGSVDPPRAFDFDRPRFKHHRSGRRSPLRRPVRRQPSTCADSRVRRSRFALGQHALLPGLRDAAGHASSCGPSGNRVLPARRLYSRRGRIRTF